jgi:hypothetical protein
MRRITIICIGRASILYQGDMPAGNAASISVREADRNTSCFMADYHSLASGSHRSKSSLRILMVSSGPLTA